MREFWLLCLGLALLAEPAKVWGQESPMGSGSIADVLVRVDLPFDTRVGSLKAGKLCFPSSVLRVSDFVTSNRELRIIFEDALLSKARPVAGPGLKRVEFAIAGIDARLCAKNFGMLGLGDRQALTGRTTIELMWRTAGKDPSQWTRKAVNLNFDGKNAVHLNEVVPRSVDAVILEFIAWQEAIG